MSSVSNTYLYQLERDSFLILFVSGHRPKKPLGRSIDLQKQSAVWQL